MSDEVVSVPMPKFGSSMSGAVIEWFVASGDVVTAGQEVAQVETEKVVFAVEAPVSGRVKELLVELEDEVDAGAPILTITASGDTA